MEIIIIFIIGILTGSFLNVCIYRIPKKQSTTYPSSHCPKCEKSLKPADLIPVISYFLNKGNCKYCGEKISPQYPIVEMLNGIIYLLLFLKLGYTILFIKYAILGSLLIIISFIDYKLRIIPDKLIRFGLFTGIIFNIISFNGDFVNGFIGLFVGGGIFLIIAIFGPMGGGDIKLMGVLGLWLGWKHILVVSLLSFIIGAIVSILLLITKIKGRKDTIPFGPFIAIATMVVILYGVRIMTWYINILK